MFKAQKKSKKLFFMAIIFCLFSILIMAQPITVHAASSQVGVIDTDRIFQQYQGFINAQTTFNATAKQMQDDFNVKSAKMNDQDKKALLQKYQQDLAKKKQDIFNPVVDKIDATIKAVADAKGLTIVINKNATIYGGQDITDDILTKLAGK